MMELVSFQHLCEGIMTVFTIILVFQITIVFVLESCETKRGVGTNLDGVLGVCRRERYSLIVAELNAAYKKHFTFTPLQNRTKYLAGL